MDHAPRQWTSNKSRSASRYKSLHRSRRWAEPDHPCPRSSRHLPTGASNRSYSLFCQPTTASRSVLQYQTSAAADVPFSSEECSGLHRGASPIALIRFALAVTRTCKKQQRYSLKRKPERTRPNSDEAGATPPFDAPCVTASVGSLPPQSRAARDSFSRVPEREFRSCKTTSITHRKGESKDKDQSRRNTTQDGNLPRFMMSRASKASWTGMLNSVMILVFLTVAPSWLRKFPEKNKLSD